jgi:hypothetical protein
LIHRRLAVLLALAATAPAQPRVPLPPVPENSAEHAWSKKKVHTSRVLDSLSDRTPWTLTGRGELTFGATPARRFLRVNVAMQGNTGQPVATAVRAVPNEDWTAYNRIAFWLRTDAVGFPVLNMILTLRNQGKEPVAAVHLRESDDHNVTVPNGNWTRVTWEIPHIARDRVTSLSFRPWVNKRLPAPHDSAAYELGPIELERVDPDHYDGWNVAPGRIAFSHTGYLPNAAKTALASGLAADTFELLRGSAVVVRKRIARQSGRLGDFQVLDFSEVTQPGWYALRAGGVRTQPFRIDPEVWDVTIKDTLNFFYAQRCGVRIPHTHEVCHRDWQASQGDKRLVMNGGWHDAGDLSQGVINTGESTHAMFALVAELYASGRRPDWLPLLIDEAQWGLDWLHHVRFPGGFRVGFAGSNLWTDGIIGTADDRVAPALNNPNSNYIAAAAGAAAARLLASTEFDRSRRSLAIAEDDWRHAIAGVETPATLSTPAFAATEMELASIGIVASVELYKATKKDEYARKAVELSRTVVESQQTSYVGDAFPLAGFFYTGPDRKALFHQFHRGNDQVPIVAMTMLCDAFPDHPDWMRWYAVVARYSEYQKRSAAATAPYGVLPAYVYRDDEHLTIAENDRYGSSREDFRKQVLAGMPMGGGYYLRAFPVWFTRRGNYGVLLAQTKALSAAARFRGDRDAMDLVQAQLQWVLGRNPFAQSTMYGEGYDYVPQYSVSVGDIVGSLPVGMMTRDNQDAPYWPASNTYVFKEVWVHSNARWLSIMEDLAAPGRPEPFPFTLTSKPDPDGSILISAVARGRHTFTLRTDNLTVEGESRESERITWRARPREPRAPWVAVAIADGNIAHRRDLAGGSPK